jgi:hypothetical protein
MDVFEVELKKDAHGLGITIAGYVCEKGNQSQLHQIAVFIIFIVVQRSCPEFSSKV